MPWETFTADLSSPAPVLPVSTAVTIESRSQLNDLLDRLEFTQKVLELLASTHLLPCDRYRVTDAHAAPWLLHTAACLLALHRAEENFYRKSQVKKSDAEESAQEEDPEPCLIERSMMDDLLYIAEKLNDVAAERNLQVALVLGVLGSFDELSGHKLDATTPPAIPAFNPDLVELAIQVAKSALNPLQAPGGKDEKDRSTWEFSKDKNGPITKIALSQGRGQVEIVFDTGRLHSWVCYKWGIF
jgi:hypothetical protein